MYHPIILERDTPFLDWADDTPGGWCTADSGAAGASVLVRSSGLLNADHGSLVVHNSTTMLADKIVSVGVHMTGPYAIGGQDEHVVYQYDVSALSMDVNIIPVFFVTMSPATITADGGGDTCLEKHDIAYANVIATIGNSLNASGTFAVPKTDHVAANRHVCFCVGMMTGPAAAAGTLRCFARLCVRRLVGEAPTILNTRKLG